MKANKTKIQKINLNNLHKDWIEEGTQDEDLIMMTWRGIVQQSINSDKRVRVFPGFEAHCYQEEEGNLCCQIFPEKEESPLLLFTVVFSKTPYSEKVFRSMQDMFQRGTPTVPHTAPYLALSFYPYLLGKVAPTSLLWFSAFEDLVALAWLKYIQNKHETN